MVLKPGVKDHIIPYWAVEARGNHEQLIKNLSQNKIKMSCGAGRMALRVKAMSRKPDYLGIFYGTHMVEEENLLLQAVF